MNSNKDYKKLYNKYKLKYLTLKKNLKIEENDLNIADNMLNFLNSPDEFNQVGGTYMKVSLGEGNSTPEFYDINIKETIPKLPKANEPTYEDSFDLTCITKPIITIPNNGQLLPPQKYFKEKNKNEAKMYSAKCMFISLFQYIKIFLNISFIGDFDEFREMLLDEDKKYYKKNEEWVDDDVIDKQILINLSVMLNLDIRIWQSKNAILGRTYKKLDPTIAIAEIGEETKKERPEIKDLIQPIQPIYRYGKGKKNVVNILYYPGHFELIVGGSIFGEVDDNALKKWDDWKYTYIEDQKGGKLDNDSSSATSNTSSENFKYEIESTENLNDYMNQFNELLNTKKKL